MLQHKSPGDFDVVSGPPAPSRPLPPALPQPVPQSGAAARSDKALASKPKPARGLAKPAGRL